MQLRAAAGKTFHTGRERLFYFYHLASVYFFKARCEAAPEVHVGFFFFSGLFSSLLFKMKWGLQLAASHVAQWRRCWRRWKKREGARDGEKNKNKRRTGLLSNFSFWKQEQTLWENLRVEFCISPDNPSFCFWSKLHDGGRFVRWMDIKTQRRGTPWTSRWSITGPTKRDKGAFS